MLDYLVDHSENKKLVLMRFIAYEAKRYARFGGETPVYLTPIVLWHEYGINLQIIQFVLADLEEREHIEIDQKPNRKLTEEQRLRRDDEEDYYLISVRESFYPYYEQIEATAEFHAADKESPLKGSEGNVSNQNIAELTFTSISCPTVTINESAYKLSSMRSGIPFDIISYCLKYHPDKTIDIESLRTGLKAHKISTAGITNLRENIRRSLFGTDQALSPFVEVSSKAIRILPITALTDDQLDAILSKSQ